MDRTFYIVASVAALVTLLAELALIKFFGI
jgi:hypothetical protein